MAHFLAANALANMPLLGAAHLGILAGVVVLGGALALVQRRLRHGSRRLRLALGAVLLAETLAWYASQIVIGQFRSPAHWPLQLCDFTLWLTIAELFTRSAALFDICYYLALAGTSMALVTPDLWERFPSLATSQFFFAHGLVVSSVLFLVWSGLARPRHGSVGRAMLALNGWAAVVGVLDWLFKTNYMYLRDKPSQSSLLNALGPWPWYIAAGEAVALALFLLLWLPFRRASAGARRR